MSKYKAIVTKLQAVRPHPNADRLRLATVMGNQIVVGLDAKDGDLGIFFPTDGQLSQEYCDANGLIGVWEKGKKVGGGFFTDKRRVRAQSFRGQRSDGYWAPVKTLAFTGKLLPFQEGFEFDAWNKVPICNKYYTPATQRAMNRTSKKQRGATRTFPKHFDTKQFRFHSQDIPLGAIISITEKLHGTSGRYGHVLDKKPSRWYHRLFNIHPGYEWKYLMGTRNVIVDHDDTPGFYGSDTFRYEAVESLKGNLRKGEVVFFEIVGWVNEDTPIMPPVQTKGLPEVQKHYGDTMGYYYGCEPGERDIYIYRIAVVSEDGTMLDLSWNQVKQRCSELGVKHVPELMTETTINSSLNDVFTWDVEDLVQGTSTVDNRNMREGVCIRIDHSNFQPFILKHKSYEFGVLEGYIKQEDSYIDIEEVS
jgi:hypothetical protein